MHNLSVKQAKSAKKAVFNTYKYSVRNGDTQIFRSLGWLNLPPKRNLNPAEIGFIRHLFTVPKFGIGFRLAAKSFDGFTAERPATAGAFPSFDQAAFHDPAQSSIWYAEDFDRLAHFEPLGESFQDKGTIGLALAGGERGQFDFPSNFGADEQLAAG
jgi:hypothetical protein